MKNFILASVAAIAAASAMAAVTFDPATGTGFVGKGDVQTAFVWNNKQLQDNASAVTFSFTQSEVYTAVCTFTTGEGTRGERTHNVDHSRTTSVAGQLVGDPRMVKGQNQFTGFNLTGFTGTPTETGAVPVVGGACPGNAGTDGTWSTVTLTSQSLTLNATHNATTVRVWGS